jgi:hypothetical protein
MATERALPAAVQATRAAVAPGARPAHPREAKPALLSTPVRAGLLLGASATVYAVTLAGVAGLQAEASNATAAVRASDMDVVSRARTANDQLQATLEGLETGAGSLVSAYGTAADETAAYQARLDALASLVAEVQGTAATLPARIQLPTVTLHGAVSGGARAPATHARSGGSGARPGG